MITTIATIVGIVAETMAIAEEIIKNSELMKSSLSGNMMNMSDYPDLFRFYRQLGYYKNSVKGESDGCHNFSI